MRPDRELSPDQIQRLRTGLQIIALHALGDREAAEEAVQETLVRALEALNDEKRDPSRHPRAFVRGIARHVIADVCAARRRRVPLERVSYDEGAAILEDPLGSLVLEEERLCVTRPSRSSLRRIDTFFVSPSTRA